MSGPPPGWHPDPSDPSGGTIRWWDGHQWTQATQPAGFASAPASARPVSRPSASSRNSQSILTMVVSAIYVALALTAGVVFLGIVPALACVRAFQRREPWAPFAAVAAVVAIAFGFLVRSQIPNGTLPN